MTRHVTKFLNGGMYRENQFTAVPLRNSQGTESSLGVDSKYVFKALEPCNMGTRPCVCSAGKVPVLLLDLLPNMLSKAFVVLRY